MQLNFFSSNKNLIKVLLLFAVALLIPRFLPLFASIQTKQEQDAMTESLLDQELDKKKGA
ncbi:hypothetical protein A3F66_05725 [candidate division TM6 bacterium RIFCSPHIGHO2_12_FULL_32_22]|nr:MAG: hypothetical protein A3F66_05725 [candidate division TM6 bacterium RIFCSPHIGHO2_12_FULL_32_22]